MKITRQLAYAAARDEWEATRHTRGYAQTPWRDLQQDTRDHLVSVAATNLNHYKAAIDQALRDERTHQ